MTCENCQNEHCISEDLEKLERELQDWRSRGLSFIPEMREEYEKKLEKCRKIAKMLNPTDKAYVKNTITFIAENPSNEENTLFVQDLQQLIRNATVPPLPTTPAFPEFCSRECVYTQCSSWGVLVMQGSRCRNFTPTNQELSEKSTLTRGIDQNESQKRRFLPRGVET
jgi:hypothetical protein